MDKFKRSLFFWSLVLIFAVTAPTVVLRAQGYRFDWQRGVFVHSGVISFKSNPRNITVTLNGKSNEDKKLNRINNAVQIPGLLPGDYFLEITAPDFHPWSKKIEVHSGVATEFWNILLTRKSYEKTTYPVTANIEKFFTSPGNRFLATTQTENEDLIIEIFDIEEESISDSFALEKSSFFDDDIEKENIEWSPKEEYLSIPTTLRPQDNPLQQQKSQALSPEDSFRTYHIIDLENKQVVNLNEFLDKKNIRRFRWDPQEKGFFFFLENNTLFRGNLSDQNSLQMIAQDIATYDLSASFVYFLQQPNNLVFRVALNNPVEKTQITSTFPEGESTHDIKTMIVYDESRIAFLDQNHSLFLYNESGAGVYFKKIGSAVKEMHYSDDGKKLLFWTENEISVFFTRDWAVQPIRKENELTNITRYSEPITNVQWYRDYEHVIFSTGKYIKIIELDPRDHRNCSDILATELTKPFVNHNYSLGKMYFTELSEGKTTLHSIEFPEQNTLFGIGE